MITFKNNKTGATIQFNHKTGKTMTANDIETVFSSLKNTVKDINDWDFDKSSFENGTQPSGQTESKGESNPDSSIVSRIQGAWSALCGQH